jgi:hypothetical protein
VKIDPHSPTWEAVARAARDGIEASRTKLEGAGLGNAESEFERGRIRALRDILGLMDERPVVPAGNPYT